MFDATLKKMPPQAAMKHMRELRNHQERTNGRCDKECDHIEADDILCSVLLYYGQSQLVEDFRELQKWYA